MTFRGDIRVVSTARTASGSFSRRLRGGLVNADAIPGFSARVEALFARVLGLEV